MKNRTNVLLFGLLAVLQWSCAGQGKETAFTKALSTVPEYSSLAELFSAAHATLESGLGSVVLSKTAELDLGESFTDTPESYTLVGKYQQGDVVFLMGTKIGYQAAQFLELAVFDVQGKALGPTGSGENVFVGGAGYAVSYQSTIAPDGTISVVETIEDESGNTPAQVKRYTLTWDATQRQLLRQDTEPSLLERLQGHWETGSRDTHYWVLLEINGHWASSNMSAEYGADSISIEGDVISYYNPQTQTSRRNLLKKLTENEFIEQSLEGDYVNTWTRPKGE